MLPRAAYVDPAVFAWEQQHFFGGGWLCVGRSEQMPSRATSAPSRSAGSVLLSAATTAPCTPSPTPAGTAATNCCRAARPRRPS